MALGDLVGAAARLDGGAPLAQRLQQMRLQAHVPCLLSAGADELDAAACAFILGSAIAPHA
jgi:hypothetical protein